MSRRTVGTHQGFNYGKGRPFASRERLNALHDLPAADPTARAEKRKDGRARWWKCRCGRTHKLPRVNGKAVEARCASCGEVHGG